MFQRGRTWWRWLAAGIAALATVTASAADAPGASPPLRDARVPADSFVRGAPLPAGVQRQAVPPTQRTDAVVLRLIDTQTRIDANVTHFVDRAIQVNASAALGAIGQVSLEYIPQYQRLLLHSVRLLRGDQVLDRTASADVRFLERETGFERGVYSGAVTVAMVIPDVRVGDTLSIAHSVEGSNPVFGAMFFETFAWDSPAPIELRRVTLTYPKSRPMRWRMLGEYRAGNVEPSIDDAGDTRTLRFEERAIEPLADEPMVPSDYFKWRVLQVSEFGDWGQVAHWAAALFPPVDAVPPELEALLAKLSTLPTPAERAAAATRWVQGEIRNFSVSLGESSHRPHAPASVLERRYGDCKDKTYLLLTLLRRLGVDAVPVLVSMQGPRAPAKLLPSPWLFDHVIVQAQVDGKTVYLEPMSPPQTADLFAISQPPPWMQGLPASEQTTALIVVGDTVAREPTTLEIEERFSFDRLGADGALEARKMLNQGVAEVFRLVWPLMSPEQRRQIALEAYEKRWPGIRLVGDPQPIDDLANNRFGYSARFAVPKLAEPFEDGWRMRYSPTALVGLLNIPPGLQRKFPLRATDFPSERRHLLTVQWPSQVSAATDPALQSMDGKLFRAETRTSFRGSRYEFRLRLSTKASDLAAADLPVLQQDLKRLDDMIPGRVVVEKSMIRRGGEPGAGSAAEAMRQKLQERIDLASGEIRSGLQHGDDLARTYCRRAEALAYIERKVDALADADEAVRLAPGLADAWACRAEVLYHGGDLVAADAALTRALGSSRAPQPAVHRVRGMVRLYLDRPDDAVADFAAAVMPDEDGTVDEYARVWQVLALRRARLPLPADVMDAARRDSRREWPLPALVMLLGDVTPQAMLAELDKLQGDERTLALAEAWFYVGQRHLVDGRVDAARQAFEKCRGLGITSYYEHVAAGFELARMSRP